jgi:hypothetical protein
MTQATDPRNLGATPMLVNDLFPHRPDYQRPDRDDDFQPTRVQAAARRFDGAPAEVAHATVTSAAEAFEKHLDGIDPDRYSASGLAEQIANFTGTDAYKAVGAAVQRVQSAAAAADKRVAAVRDSLSSDGDTAAELRATRYWTRTKGVLDTKDGSQLSMTASGLVQSASPEELGTLIQELPSYLSTRGSNADWLDAAVANAVPAYADALADQSLAGKARDVTSFNAKRLSQSVSQTATPSSYRRPNWVPLDAIR